MWRAFALVVGTALWVATISAEAVAGAAPVAPASSAPAARPAPRGAVVVAAAERCQPAAKALARGIYADARLRPAIDEPTARALVGEAPAADPDASSSAGQRLEEIGEVVASIRARCAVACQDAGIGRRLVASLGRELDATLVVVVGCSPSNEGTTPAPTARVLRVADERFVPLVLTPRYGGDGRADWPEAIGVLRSLLTSPPPESRGRDAAGAAIAPRRTAPPAAASPGAGEPAAPLESDEEDDDGLDFMSSPWFWGGLGAVVAVGVTVIALSQTSLNDPGTVQLQGRVSP